MDFLKTLTLALLFPCILFGCCTEVDGIHIDEGLQQRIQENDIPYCSILEKSLEGDPNSIKELSLLRFYDGAGYEHGEVIVNVIERIGTKAYIQSLSGLTKEEKTEIYHNIRVGFHLKMNEEKFKDLDVERTYPDIYKFLMEK